MDSIKTSPQKAESAEPRPSRPNKANPAAEVGWFLRRERERYNCSLEDAALATRINRRYLQAIEEGNLDVFPDLDDGLRYVTTYASFLGFEPAPLAQHYASVIGRELPRTPAERAIQGRLAGRGFSFPSIGALRSNAMGMLAAEDGGCHVRADAGANVEGDPLTTASIPQSARDVRQQIDTLTAEDAKTPAPQTAADEDGGLGGLTEFIQQNVSGTVRSEPVKAKPRASLQGQRIFGAENGESRLMLQANAPVWVRIEDRQGNVILTKTMMTGDVYRVPDRKDLVVIARDGGALSYILDGKKQGTLGSPGEILVGRPLDLSELDRSKKS
jgi:transcriptional regulator with XRE-family HTH domain